MKEYVVVYEHTENNWSAYSPDVPGCMATGKTREEVEQNFREALVFHIEGLKAEGLPIPEPSSDMKERRADKTMSGWINPLCLWEAEELPPQQPQQGPPSCEDVVRFLCAPELPVKIDDLVGRYREMSPSRTGLFFAPADERIMAKLVWPLKNAIACHMVGNHLGAIALCGLVAEMAAILRFEVSDVRINNQRMDDDAQKALFGSSFEKMGQERRVAVLRAYGLIDDDMRRLFDVVRGRRRSYLHFFSRDLTPLARDAVEVFRATVSLVVSVLGLTTRDGKIVLDPAVERYLEGKGVIQPGKPPDGEEPQANRRNS